MNPQKVYGGDFVAQQRNNPRTIIANWVPPGSNVLEVGPGNGVVGRWLREHKQCRVVGVEFFIEAAETARAHFDEMLIGSIEDASVIARATKHSPYNAIIFADVLEHLVDPWQVLRNVRPLLAANGHVLISVPNIAHLYSRIRIMLGQFNYTDGYLMDRTHLRWFTRQSAKEMAKTSGYCVVAEAAVFRPRFLQILPALMGHQTVLKISPI